MFGRCHRGLERNTQCALATILLPQCCAPSVPGLGQFPAHSLSRPFSPIIFLFLVGTLRTLFYLKADDGRARNEEQRIMHELHACREAG